MPTGRLPSLTNAKTLEKNIPIDALQGLAMAGKVPPTGIENQSIPKGNEPILISGYSPGYSSQPISPETAELLRLWDALGDPEREALLSVARGLAGREMARGVLTSG